jgi:NTP pyrophosphatase (non-canonical NTP hydrolase)
MAWTGGLDETPPLYCANCGFIPEEADYKEVPMNAQEYTQFVLSKVSPETIEQPLMAGALGLAGEAGEVADLVKKYTFHGHKLAIEEVVEELGDLFFYMTLIMHALETDLETVIEMNVQKLDSRYPEGFKSVRSMNRT